MKQTCNMLMISVSSLLLMLVFGCSGNAGTSETTEESGGEESASSDLYFSVAEDLGERYSSEELDYHVQTVVEELEIPWGMAFMPDGSMLITERGGTLRMVSNGSLMEEPIGGVPEVRARNQGGLLDIELHPDFEENGWIYMSYSKPEGEDNSMTAIIRAQYDSNTHSLTNIEELYVGQPFTDRVQHYGGRISFDPDGFLFFSIGDRGEMEKAQDYTTSQGNLFRLNDDGSIPEDNPFVDTDGLDEIYTYGHRNIQGMTVHPETGIIWTNEHGPRGGDEINVHNTAGVNYGWPEITYGINYDGSTLTEETEREGMEQPIMYWDPSIAPSGMAFVTGDTYPGWEGDIFNGALSFQLLSRIVIDGEEYVKEERLLEGIGRIRDVQMGPDGYLYFSNESDGTINRLVPAE